MAKASEKLITIFGGDGFVGTQAVQELAQLGYRIRVAVRRPDLADHVKPLGNVGQIVPIQANIRNFESVARAVEGADIVINCVGIKSQNSKQTFEAVQVEGAANIAKAAKAASVKTLVHLSALGADKNSNSIAAQSKALGEEAVFKAFPSAIILRPSIIFGTGDGFFNLFGTISSISKILPMIGKETLFQPICVNDVAKAISLAASGKVKTAKIYELGGEKIASMQQLLQMVSNETGRKNILIPVPFWFAKIKAFFLQILPSPLLTVDQVRQLESDNIVSKQAIKQKRTLATFGIKPTSMEVILPTYMWRFRLHGQFDKQEA